MAKLSIGIGSISRSEYIYLLDITSISGAGKTGIVYNTSGLSGHYVRSAGSATSISFVPQTANGAWASGGFAEVNSILMPGIYRVDLPDDIFSSGSDKAIVMIRGASNTVPVTLEYQLTALNLNTFTESSIASSTWSYSQRTITGGIADTVTTLSNRSGFAITGGIITSNNDKNGYTIIAGIVTSISNPVDINTSSMSSIANSTWTYSSRTITGGIADTITTLTTRSGFAITNVSEIQSGLSTVTINQIGASIGQSISDVGLTSIVTGRIDVSVSSRLASASYSVPPSEASIASTVWTYASRTITGGIADTVTTLTARSGFATTGGIITSISNPVDITTTSMSGIANTVWTNLTRTLSATGISAYDVWNFANRTLSAASGATAFEIWNYANRTLSATGLSAYDVWNYTDRIITGGTGVSITQIFPDNFEFMLITNTGRVYINKADIEKIRA